MTSDPVLIPGLQLWAGARARELRACSVIHSPAAP